MKRGKVYITGAGPGDPELLTLKALRVLQQADAVLYDRLVNPAILSHVKPGCALVYVGKEDGRHTLPQDEINELLVRYAKRGRVIVRLKGGDPFLFGRGGEEAAHLTENGVAFEIVPGVTSALSVPAYAGIPVTHRNVASSVAVITGHKAPEAGKAIDWASFRSIDTLVILMGVTTRQAIARALLDSGRDANEPVAYIESGTTNRQNVIRSTLGQVAVDPPDVTSPAVTVVGRVVDLSATLSWYLNQTQWTVAAESG